jgi:putative tricarboxylic transport membrane protein
MSEGVNPSPKQTLWGVPFHAHNLFGGLTIVALSIVLLAYTFYIPSNTTVPRIMIAVLIVIGLAVAAGLLPVRSPQDFYGGIVLVQLAVLALIASAELPGQRGFAFGPGTAPRLFAILLVGLGAAVALGGVFVEGPRIEKYKLRGPILVIAAILGFAAMIRPLGLVPATFLTYVISIFGSREMRLVESLIAAVLMTLFCVALFVWLLKLPFQLWPRYY